MSVHQPPLAEKGKKRASFLVALPVIVFAALAGVFLAQLLSGRDSTVLPSALIGSPVPQIAVTPLETANTPLLDPAGLAGEVWVVNFWASWCAPCRTEHPLLVELARREGFKVAGINYKDKPAQAQAFLDELGNPYDALGADLNGRVGIEWGVYGMPETFIIGADGTIAYKHVGPLTPSAISGRFGEALEAARLAAQ